MLAMGISALKCDLWEVYKNNVFLNEIYLIVRLLTGTRLSVSTIMSYIVGDITCPCPLSRQSFLKYGVRCANLEVDGRQQRHTRGKMGTWGFLHRWVSDDTVSILLRLFRVLVYGQSLP